MFISEEPVTNGVRETWPNKCRLVTHRVSHNEQALRSKFLSAEFFRPQWILTEFHAASTYNPLKMQERVSTRTTLSVTEIM
jgi:hypothetical protein